MIALSQQELILEITTLKSALDKIARLDRQLDGDDKEGETAESICFLKARRIAHGALLQHKLRIG